jgi:hypothetical protein
VETGACTCIPLEYYTGGIHVHTPVSTLLLTLYRRNTCTCSCFHTSPDIIQEEYMYMLLFPHFFQQKCGNRSMYMYSSCIMSEEVWKQEHVHVFLLYNVRRSVETGVCTCIPPV